LHAKRRFPCKRIGITLQPNFGKTQIIPKICGIMAKL
jgi:hypothetical protein